MSQQAETASYNILADAALMFGEVMFASAAAVHRQVAESIDSWFTAVGDSLRAAADLADKVAEAETPIEAAGIGYGWLRATIEEGMTRLSATAARTFAWASPAAAASRPEPQEPAPLLPPPTEPQAALRARPARIEPKPPAGKAKPALAMAPARPRKKPSRAATH
jgi:hypothetical protein